jgi:RNA polymerase sigma-70 factor (ECF subfamily)
MDYTECRERGVIIRPIRLTELSDEELLAEYKRAPTDSRSAIVDELFGRHYGRVARWCYRFAGEKEAAADLTQNVFLKAHRHLDSFRSAARFSSWLYSIVRNESLNQLQHAGPPLQDDEVLAYLPAPEPGPHEIAERRMRDRRLMEFLAAILDPLERTVFTLHYGDDMPLGTITRLLRLENASGAKAYIVSAKRKLARATRRLRTRGEEL